VTCLGLPGPPSLGRQSRRRSAGGHRQVGAAAAAPCRVQGRHGSRFQSEAGGLRRARGNSPAPVRPQDSVAVLAAQAAGESGGVCLTPVWGSDISATSSLRRGCQRAFRGTVRRMLAIQNPNVKRKIGPPGEKLERFPADAGENAISTVSERSYMSEISSRKRGKTKSSEGKWRE